MLRLAVARSNACLEHGLRCSVRRQWQWQRQQQQPLGRAFADAKSPDKVVLPGTQSGTVAGVPQPPVLEPATPQAPTAEISPETVPKTPPSPAEVQSVASGSSSVPPPPPPPKPKRRLRSFLLTLILVSALGYGGGVYYSLVNDNFHDFFTEYVPLGEEAVAYFEEREFRKRFPASGSSSSTTGSNWPQTRGENKVTIGRLSGVNARVAETDSSANAGSDLGQKGRHLSAVDESKSSAASPSTSKGSKASAAPAAKKEESPKTSKAAPPASKAAGTSSAPTTPAAAQTLVDHVNVPEATEPVVQDLVKMVNNIITAINASPEAAKYSSTLQTAKGDVDKIISAISTLKDNASSSAEAKIRDAHTEFDGAAKELISRLEGEMREQEARWREEFENEREKLSASYQQKLSTELDAARKVAAQREQNALLEQEVALQKRFTDSVKSRVEAERSGRLSRLNELSASVEELEQLTGQWNAVVDATLQTQHLQVALAAVRAKLAASGAGAPAPFVDELLALKEVSGDNEVVGAAIASIAPAAYQRGVPSPAALIDRFRRVAGEVRKAALLPADAGVASHMASAVLSRLMFSKRGERGLPPGDDVEATLARTEALLEEGDLDSAAREMNGLQGWAGVLSRDWVGECRRVLEVRQAIDVISAEARLQSLLVD